MNQHQAQQFAKERHQGQTRRQGTPYYLHVFAVAGLLAAKGYDEDHQIAGLFHDLLEDTDTSYQEIENATSRRIAEAVRLVSKEKGYAMESYIGRIKNNEMARAVKLADRVHNLSEAPLTSVAFRQKYIEETQKWFLDLAKDTLFEQDLDRELKKVIASLD